MNNQQTGLIERVQSGDISAEAEIFETYLDRIHWKVSRSIDSDVANIEDVVGEAYLAVLEGLRNKSFDAEKWKSLEAYIHGVVKNKISDWFKKDKKERHLFATDRNLEKVSDFCKVAEIEESEKNERLRSAIKQLPELYGQILDLIYFQGKSIAEASIDLGLEPRRISERKHYALKLLRQALLKQKH